MAAAAPAKDVKKAQANDVEPVAVKTDAGAARSEGLRLYKLAGRPTKSQFIRVYGKDGAKWTWEQRAKHASWHPQRKRRLSSSLCWRRR
jgi:hypothetical protein